MDRRSFLRLAGGAALMSACGRGGSAPDKQPASPLGDVEPPTFDRFESRAMGSSIGYGWWTPSPTPSAILVCLHGRGATHRFAFEQMRLHEAVAAEHGTVAVASVDGGRSSYWHPRRSGIDPQAMLVDELVPLLRQRQPDAPLVVLGWSMGGYGALLTAARHRELFSAVIATAPAMWHRPGSTPAGAFDDAADFERNDVFDVVGALRDLPVRLDCGSGDPFAPVTADLREAIPGAVGDTLPGGHTSATWRSFVPAQLSFVKIVGGEG